MNSTICNTCQLALRRTLRRRRAAQSPMPMATAATLSRPGSRAQAPLEPPANIPSLLSQPTWSVRSLLPPSTTTTNTTPTITPKTLHHLLRLSALPLPKSQAEESQMLATLSSQLQFVRAIQSVDTTSISPLRVIRDETAQGLREQTIGLAQLQDALASEDVVGHARRPRRRRAQRLTQELGQPSITPKTETKEVIQDSMHSQSESQTHKHTSNEEESWNVLNGASETAARRYFVVRSGGTDSLANRIVGEENSGI